MKTAKINLHVLTFSHAATDLWRKILRGVCKEELASFKLIVQVEDGTRQCKKKMQISEVSFTTSNLMPVILPVVPPCIRWGYLIALSRCLIKDTVV